jgi:hypothetical protein
MSAQPTPTSLTIAPPPDALSPGRLTDDQLAAEVTRLARCERSTTLALVVHLAEFDARRLYLGAGFSSLFAYCTTVLRLSEAETYNRIEAARSSRRYPALLDRLRDGAINLTTIRLLAPHLDAHNHRELIAAACGKSKQEVEELLARRFPQPPAPTAIRKLPALHGAPVEERTSAEAAPGADASTPVAGPAQSAPGLLRTSSTPVPRATLTPLSGAYYKVTFAASVEMRETLRRAQNLLRHQIPDGDIARILERALSELVERLEKKKLAATNRRDAGGLPDVDGGRRETTAFDTESRHIPAAVRRAVWARDAGRCAFQSRDGRRCPDRGRLEFHHVRPYAAGGEASVANISLRCRAHNGYESELYYRPLRGEPAGSPGSTRSGTSPETGVAGAVPG